VGFVLGATLHEVEGELDLVRGRVVFSPEGGACSGEIVIDARSADTDNGLRDERMHGEVLESERFEHIVFRPGRLEVEERGEHEARVRLEGELLLHGVTRPLSLPALITVDHSGAAAPGGAGRPVVVEAEFELLYGDWDVPDPSSFLLRVDPHVRVKVRALGRWRPTATAAP
jgi:polyisoprenoid-binding protein YceI